MTKSVTHTFKLFLHYCAATEDVGVCGEVVEDEGLAGGDCSLGLVEDDFDATVVVNCYGARGFLVTVADAAERTEGVAGAWVSDGEPVEIRGC